MTTGTASPLCMLSSAITEPHTCVGNCVYVCCVDVRTPRLDIYIYTCIYIYMHTYIHICPHTHTHTQHTHTHTQECGGTKMRSAGMTSCGDSSTTSPGTTSCDLITRASEFLSTRTSACKRKYIHSKVPKCIRRSLYAQVRCNVRWRI